MCNSDKKILIVDEAQHATICAALRFYEQEGQGEPFNRSDKIHFLATAEDTLMSSLDDQGIDELCQRLHVTESNEDILQVLKDRGMLFGACVSAYASDENDPYASAVHEVCGDTEIDQNPVVSIEEGEEVDGAYVLGWVWVSNEAAGIKSYSESLETLWKSASERISEKTSQAKDNDSLLSCARHKAYLVWLEELIMNYSYELDHLGTTDVGEKSPSPIIWIDSNVGEISFLPSDAIRRLNKVASTGSQSKTDHDRVNAFLKLYADKLDAAIQAFPA